MLEVVRSLTKSLGKLTKGQDNSKDGDKSSLYFVNVMISGLKVVSLWTSMPPIVSLAAEQ